MNHVKKYFNYEDKLVMLSPFSYSDKQEKVSGFNDDAHYLLNGKHKVKLQLNYYATDTSSRLLHNGHGLQSRPGCRTH